MADKKKVTKKVIKKVAKKAPAAKKVSKKVTKKASAAKQAAPAKKITKQPAAKKAVRKAAKKVTKKAARRPAAKKVTSKASRKPVAKKSTAKNIAQEAEGRFEQLQELLQENLSGINADKAEALAKNIWLAGLGVYSRTYDRISEQRDDLQDQLETINDDGQKMFEEMVTRGKELQADAGKVVKQGVDSLEDRVEEFKKRFGGGLSSFIDIPTRLREAAEKIEEISDRLNKKK